MTCACHGVEMVRFNANGHKCTTIPPFPSTEARAVTDVLLDGMHSERVNFSPTAGQLASGKHLEGHCTVVHTQPTHTSQPHGALLPKYLMRRPPNTISFEMQTDWQDHRLS